MLRKSKALDVIWKQPVTGYQLPVEMEQMTETTRNPDMLWECWPALRNDLQLIAEVFVRQALVERCYTTGMSLMHDITGD
ncbi:MAG: hypothetical protein F9K48_09120 [Candidatus Brocadia sp.]|nr:MAG: hypothetical protein F9K48_09120 [Candidatus Brocadia sp.]